MSKYYYLSEHALTAERLLRMLGVSGKLLGFQYAAFMVEEAEAEPEEVQMVTKGLYTKTAQKFRTTSACVERNLRTLIMACWSYSDHSLLDEIAGVHLEKPPTNKQFIDILAAYLRG